MSGGVLAVAQTVLTKNFFEQGEQGEQGREPYARAEESPCKKNRKKSQKKFFTKKPPCLGCSPCSLGRKKLDIRQIEATKTAQAPCSRPPKQPRHPVHAVGKAPCSRRREGTLFALPPPSAVAKRGAFIPEQCSARCKTTENASSPSSENWVVVQS